MSERPRELGVIAGRGAYPGLLANAAKGEGVTRVFAVGFKHETDRGLARVVDEMVWVRLGQLSALLAAVRGSGIRGFVMAGQIRPRHLFHLRMDRRMVGLLRGLRRKNAETIFGAVADELREAGTELLPASMFMESAMPPAGQLTARAPDAAQQRDIEFGVGIAKSMSALDVGQTVVVKDGTVLAVEAFEGTNETIRRAARLGGKGVVVVKVAKRGHDRRFDIPVIGMHTVILLRKVRAAVLAVDAGRTILLEKERLAAAADRAGFCMVAVDTGEEELSR